jgi:YidB-like protein/Putative neutral zinc metallopeptidase
MLSGEHGSPQQSEPAPPNSRTEAPSDQTGQFVSAVLGSTEVQWKEIFAQAGKTYEPPTLVMFSGATNVADSWVSRDRNKPIAPSQLEQAIGSDVLDELSRQTGLSREEILSRLSNNLPEAVDKYTPEGRIPTFA